jgi:hypothetical protein
MKTTTTKLASALVEVRPQEGLHIACLGDKNICGDENIASEAFRNFRLSVAAAKALYAASSYSATLDWGLLLLEGHMDRARCQSKFGVLDGSPRAQVRESSGESANSVHLGQLIDAYVAGRAAALTLTDRNGVLLDVESVNFLFTPGALSFRHSASVDQRNIRQRLICLVEPFGFESSHEHWGHFVYTGRSYLRQKPGTYRI